MESIFVSLFLLFVIIFFSQSEEEEKSRIKSEDYRYCILILLAKVMNADGKQMKCELDKVKNIICIYFENGYNEQQEALKQFQSILNEANKYNISILCDTIKKQSRFNFWDDKERLIKSLLEVAYADGNPCDNNIIYDIAKHLGITTDEYQNILNLFQKKYEKKTYEKKTYNDGDLEFRDSILQLLARVMKADGKQMKCELDRVKSTIRRYYKTEDERLAALKQFQSILNGNKRFHINKICSSINQKFDYAVKSELIMELLAVAYADDKFSSKEKSTIDKIVINLQISPDEYESIKNIFRKKYNQGEYKYDENRNEYNESNDNKKKDENKNKSKSNSNRSKSGSISVSEAYDILKVAGNASDAEVKKAYRVLAMMYHPDKFYSLGDEAIRQATESMKQINQAWDVVKEARGIK